MFRPLVIIQHWKADQGRLAQLNKSFTLNKIVLVLVEYFPTLFASVKRVGILPKRKNKILFNVNICSYGIFAFILFLFTLSWTHFQFDNILLFDVTSLNKMVICHSSGNILSQREGTFVTDGVLINIKFL